jgi:cytochrome b
VNSSVIEVSGGERSRRILIWDWAVRLVHWSFAVGMTAAYITSQYALSDWHARIGAALLWLLTFRIVWGFVGSTHARFAHFFPTPRRISSFARGEWRGYGHSPLGALSVFALLLMLAVQIATGLFANDDIAFQGPLAVYVAKPTSDAVTAWHARIFYVLLALVVLHIAAIAFYAAVKKKNLVTPMLTGTKTVAEEQEISNAHVKRGAFVVAALIACGVVWFAFGASHQTSPPPSPAPAADW